MTDDSQLAAELRRMLAAQKDREDALLAELRALRSGSAAPAGHHAINDRLRRAAGRAPQDPPQDPPAAAAGGAGSEAPPDGAAGMNAAIRRAAGR